MAQSTKLKRSLTFPELVIMGIVGAVGTGILFSSAGMTSEAGPGSIVAWILGGIFYLMVGLTYAELSVVYPEAGGPSRYSLYTHGRTTNLVNAFADLLWYIFIPPIEALAVVEGLGSIEALKPYLLAAPSFSAPTYLGAVLGIALLLLFIPFNYFGIKSFGKSTTYFGLVKLVFYLAVAFGLMAVFFDGGNFIRYTGGFAPFGIGGILFAIPLAMFAFGGIRVLPDYAEEAQNKSVLPKAIILTVVGQTLIYVLFTIAFVSGLNWNAMGLSPGDWGSLENIGGNPFIDISNALQSNPLLVLTLVVGIIGPFVTGYIYLGSGTRVLFAMGRSKIVGNLMKGLHKKYLIPYWSLIAFAVVGAIVVFISAPVPTIYGLITDAVVAGYLGFSVNPIAMAVSRRQGVTKYKIPGGGVVAPLAFIFASLVVFWSGWIYVSYSVLLLAIAAVFFGTVYKVKEGFFNSVWYIVYIVWLLIMTAISGGIFDFINFTYGTIIVAVVSVVIFYPWGVYSGFKERYALEEYSPAEVT